MGNKQSWCVNSQKSFKDKSSFVQTENQFANATKVTSDAPPPVCEEPSSLIRSLVKTAKVTCIVMCNLTIMLGDLTVVYSKTHRAWLPL